LDIPRRGFYERSLKEPPPAKASIRIEALLLDHCPCQSVALQNAHLRLQPSRRIQPGQRLQLFQAKGIGIVEVEKQPGRRVEALGDQENRDYCEDQCSQ